jgi:monoamine oxidase
MRRASAGAKVRRRLKRTAYGPVLRAPIGTLHWAGTDTSPEWNGKMEGALRSGERVAEEVLAMLG